MRNSGFARILFFVSFLLIIRSECRDPFSYEFVRNQYEYRNFLEEEGAKWFCMVFGVCTSVYPPTINAENPAFTPVFQWSQLEFDYATPQDRQRAVSSGAFVPGDPAPIDVDVFYGPNNRKATFVSIPRFQAGVPATLGTVAQKQLNGNPVITPYPNWDWHTNPHSCKTFRLISVYRMQIDECGRLWVLDTGRLIENQTCPPQILAFDLQTNQLLHKFEIPMSQIESRSILVTPIVDVRDAQCRDTFVYVADCQTYSIIVYDLRRDTSWRVTDKTMYPYPNYGTFSILGDSFELMDGVLGMSLEPLVPGRDRKLFYHAMSSPTENWVYTSDLRNQTRFMHDPSSSPEIFHTYRGQRRTQSAAEAIDKNGIMYFGLMSDVTVDCWNTATEYGPPNLDVIGNDQTTLQFASGVKVISNRKGIQEIWLMTSRFQKVAADTLKTSETNFRIMAAKVDDVTFGKRCKSFASSYTKPVGGGYGLMKPASNG